MQSLSPSPPLVYEWVNEWVNVRQYVNRFGGHWVCDSAIKMQPILPIHSLPLQLTLACWIGKPASGPKPDMDTKCLCNDLQATSLPRLSSCSDMLQNARICFSQWSRSNLVEVWFQNFDSIFFLMAGAVWGSVFGHNCERAYFLGWKSNPTHGRFQDASLLAQHGTHLPFLTPSHCPKVLGLTVRADALTPTCCQHWESSGGAV